MMKLRLLGSLAVVSSGAGFWFYAASSPAMAGNTQVMTATTAVMPLAAADDEKYTYVGSKKCKKCHIAQHKSWAKTKMGQAFETLKPGNAKENKEKFKLDPAKDYTKDEKCLKCHTVGFGKPGGYTIPDPADAKAVKKAKYFEGVGCESCHGPGSEYIKLFKQIQKSKRKYKVEELYAVGLRKIEESVCLECHNDESPTIDENYEWDYEKRKEQGTHKHRPLKQREG